MIVNHGLLIARLEAHLNHRLARSGVTISLGTDYRGEARVFHTDTMLLSHRPFVDDDTEMSMQTACARLQCTPEELIDVALIDEPDCPHLVCLITDGREIRVLTDWVQAAEPEG